MGFCHFAWSVHGNGVRGVGDAWMLTYSLSRAQGMPPAWASGQDHTTISRQEDDAVMP